MRISFKKEDANETLVNATLDLIVQYGNDPGTRAQAAAHEAGHVIAAHAMGWIINKVELKKYIYPDRKRWGGFTYYTIPGYEEPIYKLFADDPIGAFRIAVNALAGFIGERLVGLDHPASSMDERYLAMEITASLNELFKLPEGRMALVIGGTCQHILKSNRLQFDLIRTHLNRTGRLTCNEAKRMLAQVKPLDLKTIFWEVTP